MRGCWVLKWIIFIFLFAFAARLGFVLGFQKGAEHVVRSMEVSRGH
jgi:hypothetical protein